MTGMQTLAQPKETGQSSRASRSRRPRDISRSPARSYNVSQSHDFEASLPKDQPMPAQEPRNENDAFKGAKEYMAALEAEYARQAEAAKGLPR
jgi:hypothetical protein